MQRTREQIEDEALTIRAMKGSADALDQLLSRWQTRLWSYLNGQSRDEQVAWDLLQETCLSIASGIQKLKEPTSFPQWAFRLAHRRYVDWVRKDARISEAKAQAAEQAKTSVTGSKDELARLRAAIEQLEPQDRAVITLTYVEGFSYDEIADSLELPVGTVKSRIHYAKKRIREIIEKEQ